MTDEQMSVLHWDQTGTFSVRGVLLNVDSHNHISFASDKHFEQVDICQMGKEGNKKVGRSMEVVAAVISTICGIDVHGLNFYSNSIF
jgi:hypothetical protein